MSAPHLRLDLQLAVARDMRWLPDAFAVDDDHLCVEGWVVSPWMPPEELRVLLQGRDVDTLEWRAADEDLCATFPDLPASGIRRFRARSRIGLAFREGFARFNVTDRHGEHALSWRTAWFFADPTSERPMPTGAQIARVIGTSAPVPFRFGGATLAGRIEALLAHRLDRPLHSFDAVLDWGCGAGRLSRYLVSRVVSLTGVDIDPDNIGLCAATLQPGQYRVVDVRPPLPFPPDSFDLVLGISVITHLGEEDLRAWLPELKRVTRPGGIVLLSMMGRAQACLFRDDGARIAAVVRRGFQAFGRNPQLDDVLPHASHYIDASASQDFLAVVAGGEFEILDYLPAAAAPQDLLVLRRSAHAA